MNYDSYNEVLDYLNVFFNERVNSSIYLEKLMTLIEGSRSEKTVMIRAIYETYMQYVKQNRDGIKVIAGEKKCGLTYCTIGNKTLLLCGYYCKCYNKCDFTRKIIVIWLLSC